MSRLMVIGGFLGAGKTTVILALARQLARQGRRVAVLTNDRGTAQVDTLFLQSQGLPAYGLGGGCFCTQIDNFHAVLQSIGAENEPDVVLCEPIGSSIDLLDKLLGRIDSAFPEEYEIAPLAAVIDPTRLQNWLKRRGTEGATHLDYVFEKQMEQADVLFLNKTDGLRQEEIACLTATLTDAFPGKTILHGAAARGAGVEELLGALTERGWQRWSLPLDLSIHKQAEKELGWFGMSFQLSHVHSLRELIETAGRQIALHLANKDLAHIKFLATAGEQSVKASITEASGAVRFSGSRDLAGNVRLLMSARAEGDGALIRRVVVNCLDLAAKRQKALCKPVKPTPEA